MAGSLRPYKTRAGFGVCPSATRMGGGHGTRACFRRLIARRRTACRLIKQQQDEEESGAEIHDLENG